MGRKKKADKPQNKIEQSSLSGISYEGSVTVRQIKGGRVVKTSKARNSGTTELFNFLTECLTESFNPNKAPRFIRLFCISDPSDPKPTKAGLLTNNAQPRISTDRIYDSTSSTAIIDFLVSRNFITNDGNDKSIEIIALYNEINKNNVDAYSAYIVLDDDKKIALNGIDSITNLQITWSLKVSNSNK